MKVISLLIILMACASHHEKPKDVIREGLLSKMNQVHQCYHESDTFMNKHDILLVYTFTILPDGNVSNQKILEQSQKDPNFTTCFLTEMKALKFSAPYNGGEISVKQPFHFHAKRK